MSKYIISVENSYKKDYEIPNENIETAIKATTEAVAGHMLRHPIEDLVLANFYIREDTDPENEKHLFGTITTDECEECTCPMCAEKDDNCCGEMCAACDEDDCDNCPFGNAKSDDEPDDFDDEDCECPMEEVMAYLSIICDQLESLTSLLEKVCKVSPEK